jgi:hypothetical protein
MEAKADTFCSLSISLQPFTLDQLALNLTEFKTPQDFIMEAKVLSVPYHSHISLKTTLIHPQLLIFHFIWYHSWYILHHTCDSPVNSPRPEPSILMIESLSVVFKLITWCVYSK